MPLTRAYSHCLSWCQEKDHLDEVLDYEQRAINTMRSGTGVDSYVDVPHGTRTDPIERRFPKEERLTKLRALKKELDPRGTFTRQLL